MRSTRELCGTNDDARSGDRTGTHAWQGLVREVVQRIVDGYAPQKVILFGSLAHGTPHEDSDIDLLIVKETDKTPVDRWVEVRRLLRDRFGAVPVSPFVYTPAELRQRQAIHDFFIQEILETGKVVYRTSSPSLGRPT